MVIILTSREQEILKLSSEGKTADVIAQILGIKKRTVVFHRANIYSKLKVTTIVQACCKAVREGYIPVIVIFGAAYTLIDWNEPKIQYTPPKNVTQIKNMCMREDINVLEEVCTDKESMSISGVPICGDSK